MNVSITALTGKLIYILLIIYAVLMAAEDIKHRQISLHKSLIFAIAGMILSLAAGRDVPSLIKAVVPGVLILLMAMLTRGAIGMGDAVFVTCCACYLELRELSLCVAAAWCMCALTALIIIAGSMLMLHGNVNSGRGLPFAAYMLPPLILVSLKALAV